LACIVQQNIYIGNMQVETNPKRPYHHGSLKEALVAAGIEILDARGLEALSLRAIAAQVGVSHTAPKNHFGSLKGLLTAIAAEGFRRHRAHMLDGASGDDPKARQYAAMQGYLRFANVHPHLFRLMFSPALCAMDDPDLSAAAADSYGVLAGIAKGLDWDKSGAPDADRRSELMLWSLVHGYAMLTLSGSAQGTGAALSIAEIMPDFGYLPQIQ
jgi:AcrR family transcriptional regulator